MVLKFWTFPDGVVCENLDVRKLLKTLKFQIFSLVKLEVIIDRDSNMGEFTYNVYSNLGGGVGAMLASAKKFDQKQKYETEIDFLLIH